jgi:hypothetical protein
VVPASIASNPILGVWVGHGRARDVAWKFASDWFAYSEGGDGDTFQTTYRINGDEIEVRPANNDIVYIFQLHPDGRLELTAPDESDMPILTRCAQSSIRLCITNAGAE